MSILSSPYFKYISIFILTISILSQYEISSDKTTLIITKQSTLAYNRSHVYRVLTDIDKYPLV